MLFNSLDFGIFLPCVFILYWFVAKRNLKFQNILLLCSSYLFYGWWDWRFLSLILISTLVDYIIGISLFQQKNPVKRKLLLALSVSCNLGILGFFKYYDFFIENFVAVFSFFGTQISAQSLNIVLPVGISFYTFQTLSYSIDVYRRKIEPTRDFIAFSVFVSFFPQLVAGPIERAGKLLPQISASRTFDYARAVDGLRQILWGFFKKVVIADNCSGYVNIIFNQHSELSSSTLLLGAVLFSFQIYGDFSGYSDIAIGTARLFGINLTKNFAFPYFSRNFAEFWRRWHITLSLWLRDYLYIPLGGNKKGNWIKARNIFIVFIAFGLWHGASWTFIITGILYATYLLPHLLMGKSGSPSGTVAQGRLLPNFHELYSMASTYFFFLLASVFFRAESIEQAFRYIKGLLSFSIFSVPEIRPATVILLVATFVVVEWLGREDEYAIEKVALKWPKLLRWLFYYILAIVIFLFGYKEVEFIYFQF